MAQRVPKYDLDSLKRNIEHLEHEISVFKDIVAKSNVQERFEQAKIYSDAITKNEAEISELKQYVALIEREDDGNPV